MHPLTLRRLITSLTIAAAVAAAGCSSSTASRPSAPGTGAMPPAGSAPAALQLAFGMSAAQVERAAGRPDEILDTQFNGVPAETWVYIRSGKPTLHAVTTGTRDVPYVDPITGRDLVRQEPIIGYATVTRSVEIRLLMYRDSLVSWSETPREPYVIFN